MREEGRKRRQTLEKSKSSRKKGKKLASHFSYGVKSTIM